MATIAAAATTIVAALAAPLHPSTILSMATRSTAPDFAFTKITDAPCMDTAKVIFRWEVFHNGQRQQLIL